MLNNPANEFFYTTPQMQPDGTPQAERRKEREDDEEYEEAKRLRGIETQIFKYTYIRLI